MYKNGSILFQEDNLLSIQHYYEIKPICGGFFDEVAGTVACKELNFSTYI